MLKRLTWVLLLALSLTVASQAAYAKTKAERRSGIQEMRQDVLAELYDKRPQTRTLIEQSAGYAVFSNVGVTAFFVNVGGGTGVAHDNRTGRDTYMKMGTAGVGIGLGIKDFRGVFIFHDPGAFDYFVEKGWDFSGNADASAEIDDIGGDISEGASVQRKVSVYTFTENGLSLQATLNGTKYWQDKKLNTYSD